MVFVRKKSLRKIVAFLTAFMMAALPIIPTGMKLGITTTALAASGKTVDGEILYDFRDGSIIPTDTSGKTDITYENMKILVGTKNAYAYNGTQHGVQFKEGNSIQISVNGPTKILVGDCKYSAINTLTLSSADGLYTETKAIAKDCTTATEFRYTGKGATTLTLVFEGSAYVPFISASVLAEEVGDDNGVAKDSVHVYNFGDGSIVPPTYDSANPLKDSLTAADGFLTIKSAGSLYMHDKQHGLAVYDGDSFDVKVSGNATVTFNICQYGADAASTLVASNKKGKMVSEKSKLLKGDENDGLSQVSFQYEGVATTLTFAVKAQGEMYLHGINVSDLPQAQETPSLVGNGKTDVWDFGAQQSDSTKYNNMLTTEIINNWFPSGVAAGSTGNSIGSFSTNELVFNPAGYTNNRIRTSNTAITRYDGKPDITVDGQILTGYIYSNNVTPVINLDVKAYKNDIITVYAGSNGGSSTINFESPNGEIQSGTSGGSGVKLTFAASEYGMYKLYSTNEKLVIYRIERVHTQPIAVSGVVDTSSATGIENRDYKISFKNRQTGEVIQTGVQNGKYSTYLNEEFDYDILLENANGYIISSSSAVKFQKGTGNTTFPISIKAVDLVTLTGKITGLSEDALAKLKLNFVNKDKIYVPEFTISNDSITAQLERGVNYSIEAENINDYYLLEITSISESADAVQNIAFSLKPLYDVSVSLQNLPKEAAKGAIITFSNINEEGYRYTFSANDSIRLRDGQYKVIVTNIGSVPYVQTLTSDVKVNKSSVNKTISFTENKTWDFSKLNGNPGIETIVEEKYYSGLSLSGAVLENKTFLLVNTDGEIKLSVKRGETVNISYCYSASFSVNGVQAVDAKSGSTTQTDTYQYAAIEDGYVSIKGATGANASQTYFTSIAVLQTIPYSSKVYVGADKQYKTIQAALSDIAKMSRSNQERVEVMIDPGNYEEMLIVALPNVSLKNAAGEKASLALKNKGVDITDNAVRVTSYYGHGYNYYSMNSANKYDQKILEVNKENGYLTSENPGAGTTNGSYWNATVVVSGSGFEADGIIFENSYNQYISQKEANDTVVEWNTGGKGTRPKTAGDTSVQNRSFVERAAAMAIIADESVFTNCKFIGRQDTLYGGSNIKALFEKCDVLGATDYIFGGFTAVFYQSNLIMNTDSASSVDQAYTTAAQQSDGRGYLMYNCNITSTTPGVDTASAYRSKPGYFGRPWAANTSEAVFYKTVIQTTDDPNFAGKSLINAVGWLDSLGGQSNKMYEYGTIEAQGTDNSAARASWSSVLSTPVLKDGTSISIAAFLGEWAGTLQAKGLAKELADTQFLTVNNMPGTAEERRTAFNSLEAVLADAEKLVSKDYTKDSFAVLTNIIKDVKKITVNDSVKAITNAKNEINSAVDGLVKKSGGDDGHNSGENTIPGIGIKGAQLKGSTAVIAADVQFNAEQIKSGTIYDTASELIKKTVREIGQFSVFELTLKDASGTPITQLTGSVQVTLPIPQGFDLTKGIHVYRVEYDGSLTKLDAQLIDQKCVFATDHFSTYLIVQDAEVVTPGDDTNNQNSGNPTNPADSGNGQNNSDQNTQNQNSGAGDKSISDSQNAAGSQNQSAKTGDMTSTAIYLILLIVSVVTAAVVIGIRGRRKQG